MGGSDPTSNLNPRYDSAIDVYSYGITIWELFNFEKPFKQHDPINLPYLVTVKV